MGLAGINISFREKALTVVKRASRGVVAVILRDDAVIKENPVKVFSSADIPETLSNENKTQIEKILLGYQTAPKGIIAYVLPTEAEDYSSAFTALEDVKFNYLVVPSCAEDKKIESVIEWVELMRNERKLIKAVLPEEAADKEYIINYATPLVVDADGTEYTAAEYCGRIAGILAGTPMSMSCTHAPLPELAACTKLRRAEMETAVDAGKLIVYFDGEKVKVARGVNSFQTTTSDKNSQFKKIRLVDAMDMIKDDLRVEIEDQYIGKYANSYDNKRILISAINEYFDELIRNGVASSYYVDIDVEANKVYLKERGIDVAEMSDDEIKQADTGDKVFLVASLTLLDAIEEVTLDIAI